MSRWIPARYLREHKPRKMRKYVLRYRNNLARWVHHAQRRHYHGYPQLLRLGIEHIRLPMSDGRRRITIKGILQ